MQRPDHERGAPRREGAPETGAAQLDLDGIDDTPPPVWESDLAREARLDKGRRLRDAGMRAAELNTHPGAKIDAEQVIRDLAAEDREWTAETVRERLGGRVLASGPNSIGGLIGAAARRGEIKCVGYASAERPEAHARIIRVWRGTS